jgi:hypothetical protein
LVKSGFATCIPSKKDNGEIMEEKETTRCYTYEVRMVIQVLADDEEKAKKELDSKGGYVSNRTVTLLDSVPLLSE